MSGFWEALVGGFSSPVESLVSQSQQETASGTGWADFGFGSHQAACESGNAFSSFDWSASGSDYFNHGSGSGFTSGLD